MHSLRPTQRLTARFCRERRRSIIASDPGTGKTAPAIVAADTPALVVAPASLLINWRREIETWRPWDADQFDVVSYASPELEHIRARDYATVIGDEIHYAKNPDAWRTKDTCRLLHNADKAIALSGTLVPNKPIELWPVLRAMEVTDKSYMAFALRYAGAYEDDNGRWRVDGATNLHELRELIRPHVIRFTKEQALPELPPKQWRVLALDLPVDRREKEMSLADLQRLDEAVAFEAMSTILREHGTRKAPLAAEHVADALESEPKVVAFYWHEDVGDYLESKLSRHGLVRVDGKTTRKRRQAAVDDFQEGRPRVFLGQLAAAGVGLTLTASRRVVMTEASWVPAVLDQAADRCHRIGAEGVVNVDVLTIHRSIDEAQLRRAVEKLRVIRRTVPDTPAPWL